jgi:hypothetical protein
MQHFLFKVAISCLYSLPRCQWFSLWYVYVTELCYVLSKMKWDDMSESSCSLSQGSTQILSWRNCGKSPKSFIRIIGVWTEIWKWDLQIKKEERRPLSRNICGTHICAGNLLYGTSLLISTYTRKFYLAWDETRCNHQTTGVQRMKRRKRFYIKYWL